MRRKILKYTSVIFLWFAGLTLCAHLLLPHDHHIDSTFSSQNENCPASDNESGHHPGFPVHCHAFNDLVSEKFRTYQILPDIQYNLNAFICSSEEIAFDLHIYCVRIIDLQKPFIDSYALEFFLLRAPPSLA
jgi:hypothetical protein